MKIRHALHATGHKLPCHSEDFLCAQSQKISGGKYYSSELLKLTMAGILTAEETRRKFFSALKYGSVRYLPKIAP